MKKNRISWALHVGKVPKNLLRKMKLTLSLCLWFAFQVSAGQMALSQLRVNLKMQDVTLEKVFTELRRQTGNVIVFSTTEIDRNQKISVVADNELLTETLDKILGQVHLGYKIVEDYVVIFKKEAQQTSRVVKGQVKDKQGEPLPGVTVLIKGTSVGVVTDIDGKYEISVPETQDLILAFSFVGMESQEITVGQKTVLNIIMEDAVAKLDEVVVTGMFTRRAESFTGSAQTIRGEQLKKAGNQNVLQSLKNIDPSFVMLDNLEFGSDPNRLPSIQLRGQSGFPDLKAQYTSDPNQPLFIMDGFETNMEKINDLDMNLVESITLLKDAAAKAIYGSKAANGVVVIETKRPEAGRLKLTYTGSVDVSAPDLSSYDLCNAAEKLQVEWMADRYKSDNVPYQMTLLKKYNALKEEVDKGVDSYWLAQPVRTGVGHKHSIYMEGGDEFLRYGVDLAYQRVTGVMKGSDRSNLSGGITLMYRRKSLQFRNKLSVTYNRSDDSPWGSFSLYTRLNPYWRLYDDKGNLMKSWEIVGGSRGSENNPMWNAMINSRYNGYYLDVTNNFYGEWTIVDNLKVTGRFGVTKKLSENETFKPAGHTDFWNYTTDELIARKGKYTDEQGNMLTLNADLGLNYSFITGKHLFFLNANASMSETSYDSKKYVAEGLVNDRMDHVSFATQYELNGKPTGGEDISRNLGVMASMNYSYDDRYLADLSYRLSGSSEFGANKRWGNFWAIGAGWNLHHEAFMRGAGFINFLKLRASTGYTGSQGFSSYQAIATFDYYKNSVYGPDNMGAYLLGLANPDLQWQKKQDNNVGLDVNLFNNRLQMKLDYYMSNTTGLLTDVSVPPSMGFATYKENLGKTQNRGWQANINVRVYENQRKNITWNVFVNAAHNKNKIKKISNALRAYNEEQDADKVAGDDVNKKQDQITPSVRFEEGQSMNAIWAVRSLGIDPENGKEIYLKKDGSVTYEWAAADQVVCGDALPKINGNFGMNLIWKGLSLNLIFSYKWGGQLYNSTVVQRVENADLDYNVDRRVFSQRWQKPGDIAKFKSIKDKGYTRPTSRFVEDQNDLTFSSLNIAYDMKELNFMKKVPVERLRLSFYMNDVFTASSIKIERGTDYPFARTFSFSLQATF